MLQKIPAIFLVLLLVGCGESLKRSPIAHASRDPQHGYEIQLDCSYSSMGGPCNFPQMPHRVSESHWIYTDRIEGQVSTNHLILTYERGKTEYPWPQEALRGTVTFTNGYMHVDLQTPIFADGTNVSSYVPYRLNGDYKLEIK